MAKKFGKFLLFTAAVGSAAAAVYYYMQKKEAAQNTSEDDDYDDFSEHSDDDDDSKASGSKDTRYVPLTPEHKSAPTEETNSVGEAPKKTDENAPEEKGTFTPLSEQLSQTAETAEETVEEFFDEEDADGIEPPIKDE